MSHGWYHTERILKRALTTVKSDVEATGDELVQPFRDIRELGEVHRLDTDGLSSKCQSFWFLVDTDDSRGTLQLSPFRSTETNRAQTLLSRP